MKDRKHDNNKPVKGYFDDLKKEPKPQLSEAEVEKVRSAQIEQDNILDSNYGYKGDLTGIEVWLEHEEFRLKKRDRESERKLREENAEKAYRFAKIWAYFIGFIILSKGFLSDLCLEIEIFDRILKVENIFKLETAEFLFVIGTLTGSIFAFYVFVLRYLFYRQGFFNDDKKGI